MRANLGDLVSGRFSVPQNVLTRGMGDLVSGQFNIPQNPIRRASGMGDLVNGRFNVPQNPIYGMSGLGCACDQGMGDLDFSSVGTALDSDVFGVPVTWLLGGLVVAWFVFGDRGGEYRYKKSQLKKKYSTRGGAVQGTLENLLA